MRKLDILVPQYKETFEVVKPLLDSIAIQQSINFEEIGVIICNDGTEVLLPEDKLASYPFKIEYYKCPHKGVSATRNECLDHSSAEYVMFCDADDMFCNACGLYVIFREMGVNGGFDTLVSVFTEETRTPDRSQIVYLNREKDSTFVHGKVHRRKYLVNNNIRWNEKLTIHEDSYFNCLCQRLIPSEDRGRYCPLPFYLWKWRDDSVCRHDSLYLNKTYPNMLDSNTALVEQFLDRGRIPDAKFYCASMIYDAYYSFNCDRWWSEEGHEFLSIAEARFKDYWVTFKDLFNSLTREERLPIIAGIKNRFFQEGLMMERITFDDWISHIEALE